VERWRPRQGSHRRLGLWRWTRQTGKCSNMKSLNNAPLRLKTRSVNAYNFSPRQKRELFSLFSISSVLCWDAVPNFNSWRHMFFFVVVTESSEGGK
jgi:hypothetical protein